MSSQSTPVVSGVSTPNRYSRSLKFGPAFAVLSPLGISVAASERSIHLSSCTTLVSLVAVAIIAAWSAYAYPKFPDSPLNIDATVRKVRSIFAVLPSVLVAALLTPELRSIALRSALTLAFFFAGWGLSFPLHANGELSAPPNFAPLLIRQGHPLRRICDILVAAFALIVLAPLFTALAVAVKIGSEGPIFFAHERVGKEGRVFRMIKFRSMYRGVVRQARSPVDERDPRITAVGRVIRRFSLDELPQLINVLLGDMSLVGPRPEMPFIVDDYTAEQRERLNVLPGVTGLWQISPARALPIHKNMHYDLYYIAHQSFSLDAAILLRTAGAVLRGIGAK